VVWYLEPYAKIFYSINIQRYTVILRLNRFGQKSDAK
jgi:hypothetical protein